MSLKFLDTEVTVLARGTQTRERLGLLECLAPAGDQPPLHVHRDHEEGFYVLEGELTLHLAGGDRRVLGPGGFALAPRGIAHTYRAGSDGARWLVFSTPAGFESFVEDVAALPAPEPAALTATAAEHGIEILGPPGALPA